MFFKEEDNLTTEFYFNLNYIAFKDAKPTKRYVFIHGIYGISFEILDNNDVIYDCSCRMNDYYNSTEFVYGYVCKNYIYRINNFHETK